MSYAYDSEGIKQSQVVNGTTTKFLVDKNRPYAQVLEERDLTNITQKIYTFGDDLLSQVDTLATKTSFYHYDGLGSTRVLTDNFETATDSYTYEAFGELIDQTGASDNDYLFAGEQWNSNIGFYYLRARFYNPGSGRLTQQDLFQGVQFDPITLHKYLYANMDPVNTIDPSGYFGIGGFSVGFSVGAILTTVNVGLTTYSIFDIASSDESAGTKARQLGILALFSFSGAAATKFLVTQITRYGSKYEFIRAGAGSVEKIYKAGLEPLSKEVKAATIIAEQLGLKVVVRGTQKGADAVIRGRLWEIKTLDAPTSNAVANNIRKAIRKKQSKFIIIDGSVGLTKTDLLAGIARAQRNGAVPSRVRAILGNGSIVDWPF